MTREVPAHKQGSAGVEASAPERAASAIRKLIIHGTYGSSDRLPAERELARSLGLGRPGLREAVKRLVESGLLESRHGSGIYVAEVDPAQVFVVRQAIEPVAARLAAENRSDAEAAGLARLARSLRSELSDPDAFAAIDADVHAAVAAASANPVLVATLGRLADLAAVSRSRTVPALSARQATLRDIEGLSSAVTERDPAAAEACMRRHIETMWDAWEAERAP